MNRLPAEIVLDIASHLSLSDKLNLVLVSKQLHKTISESNIYKELVFKNEAQFEEAMGVLDDNRQIAQQVRHLVLGNMEFGGQLVSNLLMVLTRLQFLEIQGRIRDTQQQSFRMMANEWKNLERIIQSNLYGDI